MVEASKIVIMSDHHRGDGSQADPYSRNKLIHKYALSYYYENGFTHIENGDSDELWKFDLQDIVYAHKDIFEILRRFHEEGRLFYIEGNHNNIKVSQRQFDDTNIIPGLKVLSELKIQIGKRKFHVEHGHSGEFLNDTIWRFSRFIIRYIWKPLNNLGVADPTKPVKALWRSNKIDETLYEKAIDLRTPIIAGHTHRPVFESALKGEEPIDEHYYNCGSVIHPRCATAIEVYPTKIALVKWYADADLRKNSIVFKRDTLKESKFR